MKKFIGIKTKKVFMENKLTKYFEEFQLAMQFKMLLNIIFRSKWSSRKILRHVRNNLSIHSLKNAKNINNLINSELEEKAISHI